MQNNELVTVLVLSYNSAKTILETLDSIKKQTYQELELVVSDDSSLDNTVDIVKEWIRNNSARFVNIVLLTIDHNTGTSANMNRALEACAGVWIKGIAADDILLPECIQKNVEFVSSNKDAKWVVSKTRRYVDVFDNDHLIEKDTLYTPSRLAILNGELGDQKKGILNYSFIEAPSMFIKTEILREVGGYNEEYKLLEDWPMHKKLLFAGYKCHFLDDYLVGYRQSANSVFNINSKLFNIIYKDSVYLFTKNELFPHHGTSYRINAILHFNLCHLFEKLNMNNSKVCNRIIYYILCRSIDTIFKTN